MAIPRPLPMPMPQTLQDDPDAFFQAHEHKWTVNDLAKYLNKVPTSVIIESSYFYSCSTDAVRFKTQLLVTKSRNVSLRLLATAVDHFSGIVLDCWIYLNAFGFQKKVYKMVFDEETTELEVISNADFAKFLPQLLEKNKLDFKMKLFLYFSEENLAKSNDLDQLVLDDEEGLKEPWTVLRVSDLITESEVVTDMAIDYAMPVFTVDAPIRTLQSLSVYSSPQHAQCELRLKSRKDRLTMSLHFTSHQTDCLWIRYQFFLVNKNSVSMFSKSGQMCVGGGIQEVLLGKQTIQWKVLRDGELGLIHERGGLRIGCQLELPLGPKSTSTNTPITTVLPAIKPLLHHQMPTDVILHFPATKTNLHAHRDVLSARSSYFETMFSGRFTESTQNQVNMGKEVEVNIEAFTELLKYIYNGNTTKMKELAAEILVVADMYDIGELKSEAEDHLVAGVTKENAVLHLEMGDMYNAPKLKEIAMEKINMHITTLVENEPFKALRKRKPDLLAELYIDLAKKIRRY